MFFTTANKTSVWTILQLFGVYHCFFKKMTQSCSSPVSCIQCLVKVFDYVSRVLQSHREADQSVTDPQNDPHILRH
ncbi:hypothetical protein AMECASPLE_022220 [Ameca splendens]|uniref:Secreted protein n=1 Tax=Ameca splendens TaxID=208324 RepID=A0ABV0YQW6_9TELE